MAKIRTPPSNSRQTRPIIGDDPTPSLESIIKAGSAEAAKKGHSLVPWKMERNDGELRCTSCRRLLYVAETPIPGGPRFGGPAVDESCG